MTRLNIVVEGNTEKSFVKEVLAPYLAAHGVFATARSVQTSRRGSAKGGLVSYQKAKGDILRWLAQDRTSYVTSMFDYYGLPKDFPGLAAAGSAQGIFQQVAAIEGAFGADVGSDRFVPYYPAP